MPGLSHILLSFYILGYIFCGSRAWHVYMPGNIKGLVGSCLVIPCTFDYYSNPPRRPNRVVWYQYNNHKYPKVHDSWYPSEVIGIFYRKTRVFTYNQKCSLEIDPVTWHHHRQRIYPWVDPENIGRYTHRFFDKTVTIEVVSRPETPSIMISGSMKVGQPVLVQCTVYHTCSTNPPTLSLNIPLRSHSLTHSSTSGGTSKTTLTTTLNIENDHQSVECSVRHTGGLTAKATKTLNAECSFSPLTISHTSDEFLEGQASKVSCTASYTCPKHIPTLTWNYGSMPASTDTSKRGTEWSFPYQEDEPVTRGIWSKKSGGVIYHNAPSYVVDHFKGRTRILGDVNEGNCSLEIDDIKPFDNGPFCFHAEKGNNNRHRFNNSCVFIVMKASPGKPVMTSVPAEIYAGSTITVSCSVTHTCPSHPPVFSWSVPSLSSEVTHTSTPQGIWQTTSTITFMAAGGDGAKTLTCTAIWWRGKQQDNTVQLTVKGSSSRAVAIAVPVLIVVILAAVVGVVFYRRRKRSDDSLRRPPRPEKRFVGKP
ncbi:uncharacterized protein PEZ65_006764 [Lycodopsis pacificus]